MWQKTKQYFHVHTAIRDGENSVSKHMVLSLLRSELPDHSTKPSHNYKNSPENQNNLCLLPQVLLEHHAQFSSVNTIIGDPIENAKEQKQLQTQAVDAFPPSLASQRDC